MRPDVKFSRKVIEFLPLKLTWNTLPIMSTELEIIKTVAQFATPFVSAIVSTYLTPSLERLRETWGKKPDLNLLSFETKFQKYLVDSYTKYSFIPILIFQQKQRELKEIYIPLTLRRGHQYEGFVIDEYSDEFLPKYKKVLIRDTAGMGKSTLMKRLFLSCLEKKKGIPIFIELRQLRGGGSIINFILNELNSNKNELHQKLIFNLLEEGNFIFFLDGYDEITPSERTEVTRSLHEFISKNNKNLFIMTSRPEGSLASFPNFMEFGIQPLRLSESFELIRKYDKDYSIAEKLIDEIEKKSNRNDLEFLTNPLHVSLLYKSYDYKRIIQPKKHLFYRQVYDALYENHDQTKEGFYIREKSCGLDSDDFHTVLRALGFITIKHGIEYDKDQILSFLTEAKEKHVKFSFKESQVLQDLLQTVPMFTKEGNYYRWSHKSLQDYFTALFIQLDTNEQKPLVLRRMIRSKEWFRYGNVLDLYYSIDYKTFRYTIIYDYVCEFLNHFHEPVTVNFDAMYEQSVIDFYKSFTFYQSFVFIPNGQLNTQNDDVLKTEDHVKSFVESEDCNFSGYTIEKKSQDGRYVFCNYNWNLSKLLFEKKVDVFYKVPGRSNFKAFSNFCLFSSSVISVKEKDNYFPSLLTYILLNGLFVEHTISNITVPQYEKCLSMKTEIEREIADEQTSDLYDDL